MKININCSMLEFRNLSRDIINAVFLTNSRIGRSFDWEFLEEFSRFEGTLFNEIVLMRHEIEGSGYGERNPGIEVVPIDSLDHFPVMINREVDSGYWDYPIYEIGKDVRLSFICFFDWNVMSLRDNQYVRACIEGSVDIPNLNGKHALIESRLVEFQLSEGTGPAVVNK